MTRNKVNDMKPQKNAKKAIIGLTGNSGSGKSTVSDILRESGAYVVDCDKIAHEIIEPGKPAYEELIAYFGESCLERGQINRKSLATLAFADNQRLARLTEITHRYILLEMKNRISKAKNDPRYRCIVLDAPLLIEAGLHKEVDSVWVVTAPRELCITRITTREGINRETAENRLDHQLTPAQYAKHAHVVLINDKDRESLYEQVQNQLAQVV